MFSVRKMDGLQKFESSFESNLRLLRKVKTDFIYSSKNLSIDSLEIAKPSTVKIKIFKVDFIIKFESYLSIKISVALAIIVFYQKFSYTFPRLVFITESSLCTTHAIKPQEAKWNKCSLKPGYYSAKASQSRCGQSKRAENTSMLIRQNT